MEFVELSEKEFTSFAENHQYESFHQTTGWGKLKETMYGSGSVVGY